MSQSPPALSGSGATPPSLDSQSTQKKLIGSDGYNPKGYCDRQMIAAVLAAAMAALTVVSILAALGRLPSCTFGGPGGSTAVAVSSGVLTILALALALCRQTGSRPTTPTRSPKEPARKLEEKA